MDLIATDFDKTKNIVQIAFFVTTGWVAIATLNRAQRTVLQTNRAEIFKEQIKLFTRLLQLLGEDSRNELYWKLKLGRFRELNVACLLDCYTMFIDKKPIELFERPYAKDTNFRLFFLPEEWQAKYKPDEPIDWVFGSLPKIDNSTESDLEAVVRNAQWSRYYPVEVFSPKETDLITSELNAIANSPIIPSQLRDLLRELIKRIAEYERNVLNAIAKISQDLPSAYPTRDELAKANISYWSGKVNRLCPVPENWTDELRKYLRSYFEPDKIQPRKRWWHYLGF